MDLKDHIRGIPDFPKPGILFYDIVVHPFQMLWFIMFLPIYFVATRLLKKVPAWIVLPAALVLTLNPLTTGIYTFIGRTETQWNYLMAASAISVVPVFIGFLLVQRRLVSGLAAGAVK